MVSHIVVSVVGDSETARKALSARLDGWSESYAIAPATTAPSVAPSPLPRITQAVPIGTASLLLLDATGQLFHVERSTKQPARTAAGLVLDVQPIMLWDADLDVPLADGLAIRARGDGPCVTPGCVLPLKHRWERGDSPITQLCVDSAGVQIRPVTLLGPPTLLGEHALR